LAALTVALGAILPFQLLAMTSTVAFTVGTVWLLVTGGPKRLRLFRQPMSFWLLALTGLCAYHALYFFASRLAPVAEANLINYIWPLLIVILSAVVPGSDPLGVRQIIGALMGLGGTT